MPASVRACTGKRSDERGIAVLTSETQIQRTYLRLTYDGPLRPKK